MSLRRIPRLVAALVISLSLLASTHATYRTQAKGDDVCPEPNDDFQQACFLGPGADALGFISNADDIDAYRFEAYDFNATAHVEIADQPVPYQFVIADWNGDEIGRSKADGSREVADVTVRMPGSYYVFVQSKTGEFSDSAPYRISTRIDYAGTAPRATYRGDFRAGSLDSADSARQDVDYVRSGGKLTIVGKANGSRESWSGGTWWLGTTADEFTITIDSRVQSGRQAGYRLQFGGTGATNNPFQDSFQLIVQTFSSQAVLGQYVGTEYRRLAGWQSAPSIAQDGRVNRTTVDVRNGQVKVTINGAEVLTWAGKVPAGRFAIGSSSWDDPAVVSFDNIIATAPSTRAAAGSVLASDNFDDASRGILSTTSSRPDQYTIGYREGEYLIQLPTVGESGNFTWVAVPFTYDDSTLGIDVRLPSGNVTGQFIAIECRYNEVSSGAWGSYGVGVFPDSGRVTLRRFLTGQQAVTLAEQVMPAVKRGNETNHVELTCQGSTISASINGSPPLTAQDETYKRGALHLAYGVLRGSPESGEARFDNLVVTQR